MGRLFGQSYTTQRRKCKEAKEKYRQTPAADTRIHLAEQYIRLADILLYNEKRLSAACTYRKALKLMNEETVGSDLYKCIYRGLGDCYLECRPQKARGYYEKVLPIEKEDISSLRMKKSICTSIAVTYRKEKDLENELYWRVQVQELQERITQQKEDVNDPYWLIYNTNIVAKLYDQKGDMANAVCYSRMLIKQVEELLIPTAVGAVLEEYATAYWRIGIFTEDRDGLKKAQELFEALCKHSHSKKVYEMRLAEIGKMLTD
ncbi:MAG: hypothetical protein E7453_00795 [Ruminococcaceae bacterium]|nr:hypothetical protein [Oscillospiraceae bacterium]